MQKDVEKSTRYVRLASLEGRHRAESQVIRVSRDASGGRKKKDGRICLAVDVTFEMGYVSIAEWTDESPAGRSLRFISRCPEMLGVFRSSSFTDAATIFRFAVGVKTRYQVSARQKSGFWPSATSPLGSPPRGQCRMDRIDKCQISAMDVLF